MLDCVWADGENAVTLVESEGEDHGFHLYNPLRATSKDLMESIVQFINQRTALPLPSAFLPERYELHACQGKKKASAAGEMDSAVQPILGVPTRPYVDVFGYGMAMRVSSGTEDTTRSSCLHIGSGTRASKSRYGLDLGHVIRPNKTNMSFSLSATTAPGRCVFHNLF
jgi:hypothetical protein